MAELSPAVQAYQMAYTAFDKVKNTFCRMVNDNRVFDNQTLDNYKTARDNLIKAQEMLEIVCLTTRLSIEMLEAEQEGNEL